jgi:regulator of protease activity HflC (stomatin/prohibitin superfamily)
LASPVEIAGGAAVELFVAAAAIGVLYRLWGNALAVTIPRRQTVLEFQRSVVLFGNRTERVLEPGMHWVAPRRTVIVCDMRKRPFQIAEQDVISFDRMTMRLSLAGEYRVMDPSAFVLESNDAFGSFYLEVRQALRAAAAEFHSDVLMSADTPLATRIRELVLPKGVQLGVEITQLDVYETAPLGWAREV